MKPLKEYTSEEERELIAQELAETMKDIVYQNALMRARGYVKDIFSFNTESFEDITIAYTFIINDNVLKGFLGRARRKQDELNVMDRR